MVLVVTMIITTVGCSKEPPMATISDPNPRTVIENIEIENNITENVLHEFITTEIYP